MKPDASILFRSRGEFVEAVLAGLAATGRELLLADRDFSDWPLDTPAGCRVLQSMLAADPGARVRLLVADPGWLERRAPRFMQLRSRHAAAIACRTIPPSLFDGTGLLVGDRRHAMRRANAELFRGRLSLADPAAAEPLGARHDALWDESVPCLAAQVLGL